jgi:hypothetical protein
MTTQIGQVMISFRVNLQNPRQYESLKKLFPFVLETENERQAKRQRDITVAGVEKAERFGRKRGGSKILDGGKLLFKGLERGEAHYLSPQYVVGDLIRLGFGISKVELFQRDIQPDRAFLRVYFQEGQSIEMSPAQKAKLELFLGRVYRSCYGYINPAYDEVPVNTTLNFAGVVEGQELSQNEVYELRILAMSHPGHCKRECRQ